MSQHNPFVPPKPAEITLDTLPALFAHHKARFGGWKMEDPPAPPERPDGISEDEWNALGDPGKSALVREREARTKAERELSAARARPTPPKNPPTPTTPAAPAPPAAPTAPVADTGTQPDIAAIVQQAVEAAVKPFQEREQQRDAESAAGKITDAVVEAAKDRLQDASDALANIDLTKVVNDQGQADAIKIAVELEALVQRKPHLAKGPRMAPPGIGGGGPTGASDAEKVKSVLADMQRATGVRLPSST